MMDMLPLDDSDPNAPAPAQDSKVLDVGDIPKELEIYQQTERDFLPEGKTFADLTPEELRILKNQYRFSCFRPGMYQTITGFGNSV